MKVCIVRPTLNAISETFIDAHASLIPDVSGVVHFQEMIPYLSGAPVLSQRFPLRAARKLKRIIVREDWECEITKGLTKAFARSRADVVLAEYGVIATKVMEACKKACIPFVAHFHGYDASVTAVVEENAVRYREMFSRAAAVVAVSRAMERRLLELHCPKEKIVYSPYGVDVAKFTGANPGEAPPHFVAVGRFVEKKAPHLTLLAFRKVLDTCPEATLTMIGEGGLLGACKHLVAALQMDDAITLLGAAPHSRVEQEMRSARAFVQHSVTAVNGDSEGTPVAVLEAGAAGLPVVATRHAGIPDVVIEGVTGLLCQERDIAMMAKHMTDLACNPHLAAAMGENAAGHITDKFTMEQSIRRLTEILSCPVKGESLDAVRSRIESELEVSAQQRKLTTTVESEL